MFRCERCRTKFTNSEARTLEFCPLCQEDGRQAPLALKIFVGPIMDTIRASKHPIRASKHPVTRPGSRGASAGKGARA
jgi:hypothetical protein